MNWFIKNYEEANQNADKPKSTVTPQATRIVNEIRDMRAEIKDINIKLDKYQKELNAKASDQPADGGGSLETDISYMYPVPPDVDRLLYTGRDFTCRDIIYLR